MSTIKRITQIVGTVGIVLVFSILLSCNKSQNNIPEATENPPVLTLPNCSEFSGYFTIDVDGNHYELVVDSTTQYTNLYNWFGYEESAFIIDGKDQNSSYMHIELGLPGKFKLGNTSYSLDPEMFEIEIDTFNLNVSNVVFNVTTCNLDSDGIYKPLKASFTGTAHSTSWYNNEVPADTFNISGTLCLNVYIIN